MVRFSIHFWQAMELLEQEFGHKLPRARLQLFRGQIVSDADVVRLGIADQRVGQRGLENIVSSVEDF